MKTSTPARDFGELLGYAPGNVAVYSSDYDSADESIYPNGSALNLLGAGCISIMVIFLMT